MFTDYYGFSDEPFRLSPDPRFCYRHPSFAKGGAYMRYALQAAEGFVVITGAPGMGKTTLISDTTGRFGPGDYTVATLVNTLLAPDDVLRSAAYEFGLDVESMDTATVLHRLKQFFIDCHAQHRPPLLVVDEAQNLSLYALEELRMLTNLNLDGKPLLQIFLVGQNQLRDNLQNPALEQLRQRITAAAHLKALNPDEIAGYMMHRLKVVGWRGSPKLKSSLLPVIESACDGVPRRINQFCNRLFLYGAVEKRSVLNAAAAEVVLAEMVAERLNSRAAGAGSLERRQGIERRAAAGHGMPFSGDTRSLPGPARKHPSGEAGTGLSLIPGGLASRPRRTTGTRADDPAPPAPTGPAAERAQEESTSRETTRPVATEVADPPPGQAQAAGDDVSEVFERAANRGRGRQAVDAEVLPPPPPANASLEERKAWRQRVSAVQAQQGGLPDAESDTPGHAPKAPRLAWVGVVATVIILAAGVFLLTLSQQDHPVDAAGSGSTASVQEE